jgi:hypothetical protein
MVKDLEKTLLCRAIFVDEQNQNGMMPTCAVVRYEDIRPAVDKSALSKNEILMYIANRKQSNGGYFSLLNDGALVICHAWLRMIGVVDLLSIYRVLRTIGAQPSDLEYLKDLNIPHRHSLSNVSEVKLSAFCVEDDIGNQTFNFVKDVGSKIKQILTTAEESGVIFALYSLQVAMAENEIEDLSFAHEQMLENIKSKAKNLVVGCEYSCYFHCLYVL